ncbi:DUF190 domain-containing protein [Rhodobacter capsulatus]|nr:DUF190 domain-containing protein [Rhodobacter capsulatus]
MPLQARPPVAPHAAEQVTFFTQQSRLHGEIPLTQWLFAEIARLGLRGATMVAGMKGQGHDGVIHAVTLFDDAEVPVQITAIASSDQIDRLLDALAAQSAGVFYTRLPVTVGVV